MLSPLAIARRLVVNPSEEVEVLNRHLLLLDAELVLELPLSRALHALDALGEVRAHLGGDAQRVGAAGVGPHVGESDLLFGALLQEEAVLIVEQEDGECAVEETLVDVGHQVACTPR